MRFPSELNKLWLHLWPTGFWQPFAFPKLDAINMSGRKRQQATESAPSKKSRGAVDESAADATWIGTVNTEMQLQVERAIALMKSTKIIGDAFTAKPLALNEGGIQDSFTLHKWRNTCQNAASEEATLLKVAGNVLHLNALHSSTPGVPWSKSQVDLFRKYHFSAPEDMPPQSETFTQELWIPVFGNDWSMDSHVGSLEQCSAEEPLLAAILSCEACINRLKLTDKNLSKRESKSVLES